MPRQFANPSPAGLAVPMRSLFLPVVIVEDDTTTLEILCAVLRANGMEPVPFAAGLEAIDYIRTHPEIGALLIDISLPDINGVELLRQVRKVRDRIPGYMLTAKNDVETVVTAMKAGATDYFTKPFDHQTLIATLHAVLTPRYPAAGIYERTMAYHDRWTSEAMKLALEDARQAALSTSPLMVTGSSGAGKKAFVRLIHDSAKPPRKGFHAVNLAELTEERRETELFGRPPSAVAGAGGRLGKSKGGTLHLENIEFLGMRGQSALVDWLNHNPPTEAAGSATRLICTTTADMEGLMASGEFRRDLFFLLAVQRIHVPSLSERREDLPALCEEILTSICVKGKLRRPTITRTAMAAIRDYHWPHNIMELHNALEHAVAGTRDGLISPADLPRYVRGRAEQPDTGRLAEQLGRTSIDEVTKATLEAALKACDGNRRKTAQRLQLSLRTVYYMIKRYDLGGVGRRGAGGE
jgi:two-component system, NtrC family, response regulator AtoC